ncbi:MAG: 30S ribosomal protein S16 [Candidatus Hodgkinia cicadicola]
MIKIKLIPKSNTSRIVAADARTARNGKVIEQIGFVASVRRGWRICVNIVALKAWLKVGALPTKAALRAFSAAGLI